MYDDVIPCMVTWITSPMDDRGPWQLSTPELWLVKFRCLALRHPYLCLHLLYVGCGTLDVVECIPEECACLIRDWTQFYPIRFLGIAERFGVRLLPLAGHTMTVSYARRSLGSRSPQGVDDGVSDSSWSPFGGSSACVSTLQQHVHLWIELAVKCSRRHFSMASDMGVSVGRLCLPVPCLLSFGH